MKRQHNAFRSMLQDKRRTLALQHIWALGWEGLLDQDLCPGPAPAPASAASAEAAMAASRAAVAAWTEGDAPLH